MKYKYLNFNFCNYNKTFVKIKLKTLFLIEFKKKIII